jgi:acyl carrier protein
MFETRTRILRLVSPHLPNMTITTTDSLERIRRILSEHGRLSTDAEKLAPQADLYQAGMTSHASVNVMLALEGEFDIEFPDQMLRRNVFDSMASIQSAIEELTKT